MLLPARIGPDLVYRASTLQQERARRSNVLVLHPQCPNVFGHPERELLRRAVCVGGNLVCLDLVDHHCGMAAVAAAFLARRMLMDRSAQFTHHDRQFAALDP